MERRGTVVVIAAALAAGSVALAGFGLDSLIEIGASAVVVWQLAPREASFGPVMPDVCAALGHPPGHRETPDDRGVAYDWEAGLAV